MRSLARKLLGRKSVTSQYVEQVQITKVFERFVHEGDLNTLDSGIIPSGRRSATLGYRTGGPEVTNWWAPRYVFENVGTFPNGLLNGSADFLPRAPSPLQTPGRRSHAGM